MGDEYDRFAASVIIHADRITVWHALTDPKVMKQWLGDADMEIEVLTDWLPGGGIVIRGYHNGPFENRGVVLVYDLLNVLEYTHLSSVSRLPDIPQNYSVFSFSLSSQNQGTMLTLEIRHFATENIRKHLIFYWRPTLVLIKNLLERTEG